MPSEKVLTQKKQVVEELTTQLQKAISGVIVDYRGLTVEDDTKLRNKFREANVDYAVVKNTLLRFASKEVGYEDLDSILHGPTALATSTEDIIAPAKVIIDFAKNHEALEVKAGFIEGRVVDAAEITAIANTPSKEVLIAKLMGSMNSPVSSLARLLNTIVENGIEFADMTKEVAEEAAPVVEEAAPAVEETAPVAEETAPAVEEAPAEEAPAAE